MVLSGNNIGAIIGLGVVMGITHVLSGPDHLSALATLSVGGTKKAFWLGIRWGLGHSTGLVIIAVIFLSVKNGKMNLDAIGRFFDYFVGIFMIALGIYVENQEQDIVGNNDEKVKWSEDESVIELKQFYSTRIDALESYSDSIPLVQRKWECISTSKRNCSRFCKGGLKNPMIQRLVAFMIGIVHGIAGPGGILGVLPAVKMHDWGKSLLYLGTFCFVSTIIMGFFASLYGEITARAASTAKIEFRLAIISAGSSIVVGVLWIILSILGKLDQIFGQIIDGK